MTRTVASTRAATLVTSDDRVVLRPSVDVGGTCGSTSRPRYGSVVARWPDGSAICLPMKLCLVRINTRAPTPLGAGRVAESESDLEGYEQPLHHAAEVTGWLVPRR